MESEIFYIFVCTTISLVLGFVAILLRVFYLRYRYYKGTSADKQLLANYHSYLEKVHNILLGYVDKQKVEDKESEFFEIKKNRDFADKNCITVKENIGGIKLKILEMDEVIAKLQDSLGADTAEMAMLRTQEKELKEKSGNLKLELEQVLEKLEQMLADFASSQKMVDVLNKVKQEIVEGQNKLLWYEGKITEINQNYIQLKRSYDALDIEYAHLYEKSNKDGTESHQ